MVSGKEKYGAIIGSSTRRTNGAWGIVVVKTLRYKSEGPGIDSRFRQGFFLGI
jgi:hypothetical protein